MSTLESSYLKLIDVLLSNPIEQEINILNAHPELVRETPRWKHGASSDSVNQQFITCLMSVGENLRRTGNIAHAERLINLAGKLLQLEKTQTSNERRKEYFEFLMSLLQQVSNRHPAAEIYASIRNNQDKLDRNTNKILEYWANKTISTVEPNQAKAIANDLVNFGNLISAYPAGDKSNNIELAIVAYQAALKVYPITAFPHDWALIQSNLANTYRDRILGSRQENIEEAIVSYQLALEVITKEKHGYIWGNIQRNLGIAHTCRMQGDRAKNIEVAIACYNRALLVHTLEKYPTDWAASHNNLGDVYPSRILGDKAENIEVAIDHLEQALTVYTLADNPHRWAMLQNNLGNAFQSRIEGDKKNNIERSISHYQNALSIHTLDKFPYNWAMLNNNLGGAYRYRIKGDWCENKNSAIAFLNKALLVYTKDRFPRQWAEIQHNIRNLNKTDATTNTEELRE